jgi:hypothetical protein
MVMANRSASFLFLSASISERITFTAPSGTFVSGAAATGAVEVAAAGSGLGLLEVLAETCSGRKTYLGPDTDFDLPENDNLLEPSLLLNTVFILLSNLSTPFSFFSEGPPLARVLMIAMVLKLLVCIDVGIINILRGDGFNHR